MVFRPFSPLCQRRERAKLQRCEGEALAKVRRCDDEAQSCESAKAKERCYHLSFAFANSHFRLRILHHIRLSYSIIGILLAYSKTLCAPILHGLVFSSGKKLVSPKVWPGLFCFVFFEIQQKLRKPIKLIFVGKTK